MIFIEQILYFLLLGIYELSIYLYLVFLDVVFQFLQVNISDTSE